MRLIPADRASLKVFFVQFPESGNTEATESRSLPSASRVVALDLGSRNFKAVLGELQDRCIVTRLLDKRLVGLGADVAANQGIISEETLARARTALAELKSVCEREGSTEILAVATRAVRAARNSGDVLAVARELGLTVEIATGEREAELGYLAATNGEAGRLVCELGSQSMQLAWRRSGPIESISIAAGYERVYAKFIGDADDFTHARNAYTSYLDHELRDLPTDSDDLIGIAMNTMACFVTGRQKSEVTDCYLSHASIRMKVQELAALTKFEFDSLKSITAKVDKVLPGLILFEHMLERTGHERGFIANPELPVGLIIEYFQGAVTR